MSGPSLYLGTPPSSLFKFPPDPLPPAIPSPSDEHTFKAPFAIPSGIYNAVLDASVPITIASVYAVTVILTNAYNRRHNNQPWRISKSRIFYAFVILHNVALAVYSAVTCVAMVRALKRAIPHYTESNALVGTVDALCKIHGPRGLGDAVTYNSTTSAWSSKNRLIMLTPEETPDSTDVGRIWNEGLAFWGWWFYLSKFYEVFDTFIILAKGKRSTTLQTYHHTGAMLCMWAGMRYMSPPIWMFALVNAGIHAMMYTYYTISALGFRVPQAVKRSLTTMQIMQFLVGVVFAGAHLFVSYTVPVSVPYLSSASVRSATSAVSSATSTISTALASAATNTEIASVTAGGAALLKKLVLRAAGDEGLAENVMDGPGPVYRAVENIAQQVVQEPQHAIKHAAQKIVYRTTYQKVRCIDTTGESFAIWLNLIYLFPLTYLFGRFFYKSYIKRTGTGTRHTTLKRALSKSGQDAAKGVSREVESLGKAPEDGINRAYDHVKSKVGKTKKAAAEHLPRSLLPAESQKVVDSFNNRLSKSLQEAKLDSESTKEAAKETAKEVISRASTPRSKKALSGVTTPEDQSANQPDRKSLAARLAEVKDNRKDSKSPDGEPKLKKDDAKEENDDTNDESKNDKENQEPDHDGYGDEANGTADASIHTDGGLSTTDPHEEGVAYADMVKK